MRESTMAGGAGLGARAAAAEAAIVSCVHGPVAWGGTAPWAAAFKV